MEGAKLFYGLLNGLTKRIFFQETEFDDETLKTQLYPDLSDEGNIFHFQSFSLFL